MIKINDKNEKESIARDLGKYLAGFIFKLCKTNQNDSIKKEKIKDVLINDRENRNYLKLFMCSLIKNKIHSKEEHDCDN